VLSGEDLLELGGGVGARARAAAPHAAALALALEAAGAALALGEEAPLASLPMRRSATKSPRWPRPPLTHRATL
jgi:hypothetical protein